MKNNYYQSPKSSWLMRLFWKACGADRYILDRSTYSDQIKYFCLGGIVIATGVLAGLAGGYAIYTIFEPKGSALDSEMDLRTLIFALIFGVIWGLVIFNIDRFIVTSTGKGDGTEKITKQEFVSAIPRIIMGVIIALTISKPIEIRMFKSEIDQQLFQKQENLKQKAKKDAEIFYDDEIERYKLGKERLQNEISQKEQRYYDLEEIARQELDGTGGSGNANPGPIYQAKKANAENAKKNWSRTEKVNLEQIKLRDEKIDELLDEKKQKIANSIEEAEKLDGLLERIKLAHKVAGWEISLFITLLFMVIELTPIFFKMMLIKGPYDYMDENIRELAKAEAGIEVHYNFYINKDELTKNLKEEENNNINKTTYGYEVHKIINHGAELKRKERIALIKAQEELNEDIIKEWKAKKKEDIKNNPDKYIQED
jgi:hypothetical protein